MVLCAIPLVASLAVGAPHAGGAAGAGAVVTVKGKTVGTAKLLNPVWNDAKDPEPPSLHVPRAVGHGARRRAHADGVPAQGAVRGRARPWGGEGEQATAPRRRRRRPHQPGHARRRSRTADPVRRTRTRSPTSSTSSEPTARASRPRRRAPTSSAPGRRPAPASTRIRDQLAPSIRSWIVVEPHLVSVGYPDRKGDFQIDLDPGSYTLRGYFNGEPVGAELPVTVAPVPVEQPLKLPLVIGESEAAPGAPALAPGKPGAPPKHGGGG